MSVAALVLFWLGIAGFNYWCLSEHWIRSFGRKGVDKGDWFMFGAFAIMGPLCLGASLSALFSERDK